VRCEGGRWPAVTVTDNRLLRVEGKQPPRPPQYVDAQAETAWADRVVQRLLVRRGSGTPPSFGITVPVGPPPRGSRPGPSAPPSRPQTGDQPGTSSTSPAGKTYQGTQGR
jgi:hypothetical protein